MKVILGTSIVPTTIFIILFVLLGIQLTPLSQFIYAELESSYDGIEYTESEWGIKINIHDPWKLSSNSNNPNNLCDNNNKFKCLIVLDNALVEKPNSMTIFAEKGQDFKTKCQCDSLLEFVQYDYTRSYGSLKNFFLIGDNQTILNGNLSAWQMEYNTINKNNMMNHLIMWAMAHDIFYKISYHAQKDIYSNDLPSVKEFINTIEFVVPTDDSQSLSTDNLPSFMTINNTKEEKKKQPSFMITENTKESNILQKEKISISAKEPNEDLTAEKLVNETIALENQTINEIIIGQSEEQLQEDKKDLVLDIEESGKVNQFVVNGQDICKSGNCKYEINKVDTFLTDAPNYNIYFNVDFRIFDEANKDPTPKKREFVEQWRITSYCIPDDIIEKPNGQERYLCINDTIELQQLHTGKSYWLYEANSTYFIPEDKFITTGTLSTIGGK